MEVFIKKIVPNGLGLAFAENLTLFVPLAVKGDRLRVEIRELKGKTAFARIVEILEASDQRIEPKCEYFGICGGCNFQQMSYQAQIESKLDIIQDCLRRIGKIEFDDEIHFIRSPKEFGYRIRTQWHLNTQAKKIGYYKSRSHEIVQAKNCGVLVPELEEKLNELRNNLAWETFFADEVHLEAVSGEDGRVSIYSNEALETTEKVTFPLSNYKLSFDASVFFQGNRYLIDKMADAAIGDFKGEKALDLFCGVGLFSIPLAKRFENVFGVESNSEAVKFARKNAKNAGFENIEFFNERVKSFLKNNLHNFDFILVDPPRSGLKNSILKHIADLNPKRISYVSCNPSTLARDLAKLLDSGYKILKITAFDLFPQTHHVETVVHLSK